jgi:uncharacterized protein
VATFKPISNVMATKLHFSPRPNRAAEIRWRDWDSAAFDEATAQGKPVLLAISAVWCHWCHVMDETTYSDPGVIELVNERFVPIRVDNDQRPDVNTRYNMGGWPTTVVLTGEGEILKGGTYIPPEAMRGFLEQVSKIYAEPGNRLDMAQRIRDLKAKRSEARPQPKGELTLEPVQYVAAALSEAFDDDFGGFGTEPKFPQVETLHFLLDYWTRSRDGRAQTMVQMTLRGMAGGGMYDHVEGAFFRYSTTRDFSVPHFEKMLEDLAGLMLACARAGALFGDVSLSKVAVDCRRYLDATLWNAEHGGYGGSQDADESYYALDAEARKAKTRPYVDPIIYTSWNAEMARALIMSGPLLGNVGVDAREWIDRGVSVLEMLWSKSLVDGLMARYYDGTAHLRGLLGDQAWSINAALAAFAASGERVWLDRALSLLEATGALYDEELGGYLDRLPDPQEPGRVSERVTPLVENSLMARALLDCAALSGEGRFEARARAVLARFISTYKRMGVFAAGFASAVLHALEPPIDVKIAGSADAVRPLRDAALRVAAPAVRVNTVEARDAERLTKLDVASSDGPVAFLCRGTTCFAKIESVDELLSALSRAR